MTDDFWEWLPKAYGEVGDEPIFTKYNMEIAFAAGAEAEAQRMWQGLTDEEIEMACVPLGAAMLSFTEVARAIEAKLKEKNT
jgi:hypothetical protein